MQSHHLDTFESSLVDAHVCNLLESPLSHLLLAEDAGLDFLDEAFFLREDYLLDFTGVKENDAEDEQ